MDKPVYTEQYKGHEISIFSDDGYESPDGWGDTGAFLVCKHREMTVERDGFAVETVFLALHGAKDDDGEIDEEAEAIAKDYYIFPVEAYIHSGIVLHLAGGASIDRAWDVSGNFGFILVKKDESRTLEGAERIARGTLQTWNESLSGNVYGYKIDGDGDSCWGYYGDYETGALEAAREIVDGIDPKEWEREQTMKKIDALKRWEMSLSTKEREAIARSVKSIEKQLFILAGNK